VGWSNVVFDPFCHAAVRDRIDERQYKEKLHLDTSVWWRIEEAETLVKRFSMFECDILEKLKTTWSPVNLTSLANKNLNANLHTKRFCSHCRRRGLAGIYQVSRSNSRNEKRNRD
jgi:hypothetical protein